MAAGLTSGIGLAERVVDPFEHHGPDYTLEGPQHRSEVFYMSSNWYDQEGHKHDDRVGDLMGMIALASIGGLALASAKQEQEAPIPIT